MACFKEIEKFYYNSRGTTKNYQKPNQSWERTRKLEVPNFLISKYIIKYSNGTGIKKDI